MIDWTIYIRCQFPLSRDILLVRGLIIGISIPCSTSLPTSTLYSYRGMWSLMNYSYACKLIRWHSTERAQSISIRHQDGQIPLLIHMPQLTLSKYLIPPLLSPIYAMTFDVIKVPFRCKWFTWSHGRRIKTTMYWKLIANELDDLILCYAHLGVCPLYHSTNDITLLLITSNVHDHETMIIY